jgi:hypothetical protein
MFALSVTFQFIWKFLRRWRDLLERKFDASDEKWKLEQEEHRRNATIAQMGSCLHLPLWAGP